MNKRSLPRMQFSDLAAESSSEPSEHLSSGTKRAVVSRGTGIQIRTRLNWGWGGCEAAPAKSVQPLQHRAK